MDTNRLGSIAIGSVGFIPTKTSLGHPCPSNNHVLLFCIVLSSVSFKEKIPFISLCPYLQYLCHFLYYFSDNTLNPSLISALWSSMLHLEHRIAYLEVSNSPQYLHNPDSIFHILLEYILKYPCSLRNCVL